MEPEEVCREPGASGADGVRCGGTGSDADRGVIRMDKPAFTPGPWVACVTDEGHEILMGDFLLESGELKGMGRQSHHEIQYEHMCYLDDDLGEDAPCNVQAREAEANANLIAAAPDMYEALSEIWEAWLASDQDTESMSLDALEALLKVEKALAKAEGRQ